MKKLSWAEIEKIADELANKIRASGFKPDYIIGIDNVLTITATSCDKDRKKDLKILYLPQVDLSNKKVLLVDEITETGDTLEKISPGILPSQNSKYCCL